MLRVVPSLERLNLSQTQSVDDKVVLNLVDHCPMLQELVLHHCAGLKQMQSFWHVNGAQLEVQFKRMAVLDIRSCYLDQESGDLELLVETYSQRDCVVKSSLGESCRHRHFLATLSPWDVQEHV